MKDAAILIVAGGGLCMVGIIGGCLLRLLRQRELDSEEVMAWLAVAVLSAAVCITIFAIGFVAVYA